MITMSWFVLWSFNAQLRLLGPNRCVKVGEITERERPGKTIGMTPAPFPYEIQGNRSLKISKRQRDLNQGGEKSREMYGKFR